MSTSRGIQGALLKLIGAPDVVLTVTGAEDVTAHYRRITVDAGGLFERTAVHPTMWLRVWFPPETEGESLHQRAYTLVDPDPDANSFTLEFALHDGLAARWARRAVVGDTVVATLQGSKFALPDPLPDGYLIVGDAASRPAITSLLRALPAELPVTVWFETVHADDDALSPAPRAGTEIVRVPRRADGASMVEAVSAAAFDASGHAAWVACDTVTTRAVTAVLKSRYGVPRRAIKSQGYWIP